MFEAHRHILSREPSVSDYEELFDAGFVNYQGILYKYVSYETALLILSGQCLKYSVSDSFNDPFDLTMDLMDPTIDMPSVIEDIKSHWTEDADLQNILISLFREQPGLFGQIFFEAFENIKRDIGICCFSKSPLKTLMWSHYADHHRGVCLGFRFSDELPQSLMQFPVRYVNELTSSNLFEKPFLTIVNWLFTKSHVWEYEEEVRIALMNNNGLVPFHTSSLSEVYYGLRLSPENISNIKQALVVNNFTPTFEKQMRINKLTFDLTTKPVG
jgi:hypothetical protein